MAYVSADSELVLYPIVLIVGGLFGTIVLG
jgi:hypothetical protein